MKLKLRSEGTPINSEIYAKSLAGTEGSAKAEAASQDGPAAAHRRQPKDAGVFVPEGPDDGCDSTELAEVQAWNAWKVPSRSPSRLVRHSQDGDGGRVRYDRWPEGVIVPHGGQNVAPQITPFPPGQRLVSLG
jgi:hypothetical protein